MSDEEPWEPLTFVDYVMLGMVGAFQAFALGVCIHLIRWRKWPPYVTKNVDIVIIMTLAGFAWTFASALETGIIERSEGDFLANCYFEVIFSWSTLLAHMMSFAVRVYRMWRILIKHDDHMWPAKNVVLAMNALGFYAICYLWFVCARQLRWVRKQFNEYEAMKWTLSCLTLLLFSYAAVVAIVLNNQHVYVRRVAIVYPVLTTYTLLWGSIGEPIKRKLAGDTEYLYSFTKGFSEMPSPAQLKASLAEQLSVQQLRVEFRKYVETMVAQELVDFYLDSLDREEIKGYFGRQAATMRIVEQYIREGSPDQVNISGECREEILSTDVTAYDIFDRARAEVLAVMETNFQRDFIETEGFRRIVDASELEQRQMRLLRAEGVLVPSASTTPVRLAAPPSIFSPRGRLLDSCRRLPLVGRLFSFSSPSAVAHAVSRSSTPGAGSGEVAARRNSVGHREEEFGAA
ncbi:similar to regulator of G-protein signaling 16 [Ectocarpus siliculosus]|uniref:Similar to regulator of G-protein signaling 16 n=1 Tax=Ectocarpus siliculosus TaxID=2880 RepID=D7FTZ7_ECTSI|nr:similar to regulator of G-protein signaling 16 [Ectocarpus siliculosus]|eukprot:CBJ31524.1 similar to regulator of G-protein signaling 16 [Ectocarpus siliculosus]